MSPYKNGIINPRDFGIELEPSQPVEYLFPFEDLVIDLDLTEVTVCDLEVAKVCLEYYLLIAINQVFQK
jgi:hypothetical protein